MSSELKLTRRTAIGSDVVIARDNPEDSFVVGEDNLSDLIQRIKSDNLSRFIINMGGELEAERRLLKNGIFWGGVGVVFFVISGGILLL